MRDCSVHKTGSFPVRSHRRTFVDPTTDVVLFGARATDIYPVVAMIAGRSAAGR